MAILPWRTRRQFFYFSIFALAVLVVAVGVVYYFYPKPDCFDGKQNQNEEGIDCGGSCTPCLGNLQDISVIWVRFFENKPGHYDAAALINNPNLFAGMPNISYIFKLYDDRNFQIASKIGATFINPGEQQVIFVADLVPGPRVPKRATFEFTTPKGWIYFKTEKSFLSVTGKNFTNTPFPRLVTEISNDSLYDIRDIYVSAILYDEAGNAQAVSSTKIDLIKGESSAQAILTWGQLFNKMPSSIEVIPTTDLVNNRQ